MIISHRHKFIFIKNRKVGSTSVERALQPLCGAEDVLTPDHLFESDSDVLMAQARNYEGRFNPLREMAQCRDPVSLARVMRDALKRPRFYNHMRASSVRARVPQQIWDSYYKFTFDRNPWDKVISFYYWFGRHGQLPEFNTFVQNHRQFGTTDQTLPSDWTRYTLHNRIIVDDVFDFADLAGGLRQGLAKAGVPQEVIASAALGQEKTSQRKPDPIALAPQTDAIIRRAFASEIATFGFCAQPLDGLFT